MAITHKARKRRRARHKKQCRRRRKAEQRRADAETVVLVRTAMAPRPLFDTVEWVLKPGDKRAFEVEL